MTRTKMLRDGQVALPAEAREALRLEEGDDLEVEVVEGTLVLTPVAAAERAEAWRRIREAQASVRYIGPEPRPSPEEEEAWVYEVIREYRDRHG